METEIYLKLSEAVDKFVEANARGFTTDQIVHFLNRLPKYEVPKIVRCDDCKRSGKRSCPFTVMGLCYADDDFCSYGKRWEDE